MRPSVGPKSAGERCLPVKWLGMCLFTFISWWICVDTVLCVRACAVCLRSLSAVCVCVCVCVYKCVYMCVHSAVCVCVCCVCEKCVCCVCVCVCVCVNVCLCF